MKSFDEVTRWEARPDGAFVGEVTPEWMQGRAAFGGLVAAAALNALEALVEPERRMRSFSLSFVAPIEAGPVEARPIVLRAGRAMTHGEVRVVQGGEVRAVLLASAGADRPSEVALPRPRATPPGPPEAFGDLPYIEGVVPRFIKNFQLRWAEGAPPFSGVAEAAFGGWCRHRSNALADAPGVAGPAGPAGPAAIVGLLDAWPAPTLPMLRRPAPASTVRWAAHIVAEPASSGGWYWYTSRATTAGGGYASTLNHLYDAGGELVAWSEQLVAIFDR